VGRLGWTQHSEDGVVVVRLAGDLDLSTASQFGWQLRELTGATIVLDLSEVAFIDARCVGLIVQAWDAANTGGHELRVTGLYGIPARVFDVLGLAALLGGDARLKRAS
jgi:anti-anti-sigma factor